MTGFPCSNCGAVHAASSGFRDHNCGTPRSLAPFITNPREDFYAAERKRLIDGFMIVVPAAKPMASEIDALIYEAQVHADRQGRDRWQKRYMELKDEVLAEMNGLWKEIEELKSRRLGN
jgi:hypothetical protein